MPYHRDHLEGESSTLSSAVSQRWPESSVRSQERIMIEPLGGIQHYNDSITIFNFKRSNIVLDHY